ncbi:hypothetical protein ACN3XK_24110, partial [Actinomadura welshii]
MAASLAWQTADLLAHVRQVIERSGRPGLTEQIDRRVPDRAAGWQLLSLASTEIAPGAWWASGGRRVVDASVVVAACCAGARIAGVDLVVP